MYVQAVHLNHSQTMTTNYKKKKNPQAEVHQPSPVAIPQQWADYKAKPMSCCASLWRADSVTQQFLLAPKLAHILQEQSLFK